VAYHFPGHVVDQALRLAYCEARAQLPPGDIRWYDSHARGAMGELGLFQIHPPSWQHRFVTWFGARLDLLDPWANTAGAYQIWKRDGGFTRQWVNCSRILNLE
jgi:hypothetical protein